MSDDAVKSKAVFFLVFLLLLVVFSAVARAQPALQVEDLNTTRPDGSNGPDRAVSRAEMFNLPLP